MQPPGGEGGRVEQGKFLHLPTSRLSVWLYGGVCSREGAWAMGVVAAVMMAAVWEVTGAAANGRALRVEAASSFV